VKKLAALLLLAAACGPGLVEFPVVPNPPVQTPDGGGPGTVPASAEVCGGIPGAVYCGNPTCDTLNVLHCGPNNAAGTCEACPANWSCTQGVGCVPPTACPRGQVLCATSGGNCCSGTQLAAGPNDTCAIVAQVTQQGSTGVYCWGADDTGQLGPGGTGANSAVPVEILALRGATAVAIGSGHGCAIMADQSVKCWGKNNVGQLGSGATSSQSAAPVLVPEVASAVAIAVGDEHSCAISTASGVVCWGANNLKQLGDTTVLPTLKGATKIVAGANHTCAMSSGSVVCWGANDSGQIGNGTTQALGADPFTVPLTGNTGTIDIAAGSAHTCAIISGAGIDATNGVRCWGANGSNQLDGTGVHKPSPVTSPANVRFFNSPNVPDGIAAGRAHTCARRGTDEACSGSNASGQSTLATNLKGPGPFGLLVAGGDHTCLIDTTNEIVCFGLNASNELGPYGPTP